MKRIPLMPASRPKKTGMLPASLWSCYLLITLLLTQAHQVIAQGTSSSDGYIPRIREYMGTYTYVNSQIIDDTLHIGIGTPDPQEKLDVYGGNIRTTGSFISLTPQGNAPLVIQSSTLVPSLNSDMIDGLHATSFAGYVHTHPSISGGPGLISFDYNGTAPAGLGLDFGGNGSSNQPSRSDHSHTGMLLGSGTPTQVAFFNGSGTVTGSPSLFWDQTGNRLGIGTQVPAAALHISTNGTAAGIRLSESHNDPHFGNINTGWDIQNTGGLLKFDYLVNGTSYPIFRVTSSGATGTLTMNGTLSAKRLQLTQGAVDNYLLSTTATGMVIWKDPALVSGWTVRGSNVYKTNGVASVGTTSTEAAFNIKSTSQPALIVENAFSGSGGGYAILAKSASPQNKAFAVEQNGAEHLVIWGDGLLQVDNKIKAREVEVSLNVWQDAVFEKDYPLPGLAEVETYIEQHHHLPGIPSEEEVLREGIALGEMNALLLQKIEELTLYLIEMNKVNASLEHKIEQLTSAGKP